LLLPPALDHGHESHFPLVLAAFIDHLERGSWPESLPARLRLRYTLLARARDLALHTAYEALWIADGSMPDNQFASTSYTLHAD
jgi:hypothetical protein